MSDLEQRIRKFAEGGQLICTMTGSIDLLEVADRIADLERQNAELVRQLAAQSADAARLDLASIIRRSGYATSRQANEIADSIRAAMQAGKEPTK